MGLGFGVSGSGFGFRASELGFGVWGLGIGVLTPPRPRSVLGSLGYHFSQHSPTTRPSVERTAGKAFLLSDRV